MAVLVAFVALVGLVLVNLGGASGLRADPADFVMRLHLDTDGDYFRHGTGADELTQNLVAGQCLVDEDERLPDSLVSVSGSNTGLGLSFDSLGVRSKGPGRSCGRVSGSESFTISINNASGSDLEGLNFDKMELDIEAKQDAVVVATAKLDGDIVGTFTLRTGSSATGTPDGTPYTATSTSSSPDADCLQGVSDSGADSGANDNCRWVVEPDIPFDAVTFTSAGGEFGLEGGEDGTPPATPGENSDSLFYLTDVGVLDCGDTVDTGDALGEPLVSVTRQFQAGCQLKEFFLGSSATNPIGGSQSFTFAPSGGGPGQAGATFETTVTWVPEPAVNPLPVTQMDFNGDGDATDPLEGDLVWCDGTSANPVLPSTGEPWCRVEQHVTLVGTGLVQVTEDLLGTEDPNGWR
jgi:hypothetical protein